MKAGVPSTSVGALACIWLEIWDGMPDVFNKSLKAAVCCQAAWVTFSALECCVEMRRAFQLLHLHCKCCSWWSSSPSSAFGHPSSSEDSAVSVPVAYRRAALFLGKENGIWGEGLRQPPDKFRCEKRDDPDTRPHRRPNGHPDA